LTNNLNNREMKKLGDYKWKFCKKCGKKYIGNNHVCKMIK